MGSGAVVNSPVPPSVSASKITPNPHPYAIKTTTTGLLTRSNSSSQNIHVSRHYYVPPSPTAKKHEEVGDQSPQASQPPRRTHRLSKSLSGMDSFESPNKRPLPAPPPHSSTLPSYEPPVGLEQWSTPKRPKRADTLSLALSDLDITPVKLEDLPTNPKLWTPTQLSSYLTTALRVRSGEAMTLPLPVARDIATFVKESKINGRLFLRLCEQDLDATGVNRLWKDALLTSSRNLRRNVLRGKIWQPPAEGDTGDDLFNLSNSSASSLDSSHNFTDGDNPGPHYIKPYRRHRNGRVRGMVESFERSGSFSSDSSFSELAERNAFITQCDISQDVVVQSPVEAPTRSPELSAPIPLPLPLPPPAADSPSRLPNKRPLPQIPVHPSLRELPAEELTVEELLEAEDDKLATSWGARAWEEFDDEPGITVKRIAQPVPHSDDIDPNTTMIGPPTNEPQLMGGDSIRKQRDERRVVTAIFSPAVPPVSQISGLIQAPGSPSSKTRREEELEDQVKSTTLMLQEYKKRLEEVERKVSRMAEVEVQLAQKIEEANEENRELQERILETERKATQSKPDNPSGGHVVIDQRGSVGARRKKVIENMDPQSISALSQYVLLVGVGVCAVVFRVVLKKVIGKGLKP